MKPLRLPLLLASLMFAAPLPGALLTEATPEQYIWFLLNYGHPFVFFDEARSAPTQVPGWSAFPGNLTGGQTFDTDLFTTQTPALPSVWWDFGNSGYTMSWILVARYEYEASFNQLYVIADDIKANSQGMWSVKTPDAKPVYSIAFYGVDPTIAPIPELPPGIALLSGLMVIGAIVRRTSRVV